MITLLGLNLIQFAALVGDKTRFPDLGAAIVRRLFYVLAGDSIPYREPRERRLLEALILWLIRAEGDELGPLGTWFVGETRTIPRPDDVKDAMAMLLQVTQEGPGGRRRWESCFLPELEEVACCLVPGASISVCFEDEEPYLVLYDTSRNAVQLSVEQICDLGLLCALSHLCAEVESRQQGNVPKFPVHIEKLRKPGWRMLESAVAAAARRK